jgi:methylenetetrahydrofolate dehydrogenase (NADP+)/methenyltetrahydrofolate cyclohydrolase
MGTRWSCKPTAERLKTEAQQQIEHLNQTGIRPGLAVILVGNHPASQVYVGKKLQTCRELAMHSVCVTLPEDVTAETILGEIDRLNRDPEIHGILVQLPLPKHLPAEIIINRIHPDKDVDGFHPVNVGRLSLGQPGLFPCTPMGIMALLSDSGVSLKGKHAVIVGRSNIVGKPMAQLLLSQHATVTMVHSRTETPQAICAQGDLVIAAVGIPHLIDHHWLKKDALVVDVGINEVNEEDEARRLFASQPKKLAKFLENGRALVGDVATQEALSVAHWVTPVPGGVGGLTIGQLMLNCCLAAQFQKEK